MLLLVRESDGGPILLRGLSPSLWPEWPVWSTVCPVFAQQLHHKFMIFDIWLLPTDQPSADRHGQSLRLASFCTEVQGSRCWRLCPSALALSMHAIRFVLLMVFQALDKCVIGSIELILNA